MAAAPRNAAKPIAILGWCITNSFRVVIFAFCRGVVLNRMRP